LVTDQAATAAGKYGFVMNEVTTAAEKFYIADEEGIYNVTTLWKWKMCC